MFIIDIPFGLFVYTEDLYLHMLHTFPSFGVKYTWEYCISWARAESIMSSLNHTLAILVISDDMAVPLGMRAGAGKISNRHLVYQAV